MSDIEGGGLAVDGTETNSVLLAGMMVADPNELEPGRVYSVADGAGRVRVIDTDSWADSPRRVIKCPEVSTPQSLLDYLSARDDQPSDGLEVWASEEHLSVVAILDGLGGWGCDRVALELKRSPEWVAWSEMDGVLYNQRPFADFVESQLSSIAEPDAATLLEIVQTMEGTNKASWKSAEWLANGQRSFRWEEEIEAKAGRKGSLTIPATFTLGLRPFVGAEPFKVAANLRYRVNNGELVIGFRLVEPERIIEAAFADVVKTLQEGLPVPVFMGRP